DVLDKTVAIGHLHLWKRVRVDHVVLADDSVEVEKIGGNSISLVVRQRFRFLVRHGGEHVVEDGRGIGPEGADRLDARVLVTGRPFDACKLERRAAYALLAVAGLAFGDIDGLALLRRTAAMRKPRAIRLDRDVPGCNLLGRSGATELRLGAE